MKDKIEQFFETQAFSLEKLRTFSRLVRERLCQRISALTFAESLWDMEQCEDKRSLQFFYNSDFRGGIGSGTDCVPPERTAHLLHLL